MWGESGRGRTGIRRESAGGIWERESGRGSLRMGREKTEGVDVEMGRENGGGWREKGGKGD